MISNNKKSYLNSFENGQKLRRKQNVNNKKMC